MVTNFRHIFPLLPDLSLSLAPPCDMQRWYHDDGPYMLYLYTEGSNLQLVLCIYLIEGRYRKEPDLIPLDLLAFPVLSLIVSLGYYFLCILEFEYCLGNPT